MTSIPDSFGTIANWLESAALERSQQLVFGQQGVISTDVGLVRKENQDRVAVLRVTSSNRLFACIALSDGMGGMKDGGTCATVTVAAFFESLIRNANAEVDRKLELATRAANETVFNIWRGKGGATLSAVLVEAGRPVHFANVGDSRVYGVGEGWKDVRRLTVDDSLKEAFGGEDRGLLQFIGIGSSIVPKVEIVPPDIETLFITSDGAHYFDQEIFRSLIEKSAEPVRATERLLALARWLGGPDNASIAAFKLSDVRRDLDRGPSDVAEINSGLYQLSLAVLRAETLAVSAPSIGQPSLDHQSSLHQKKPSANPKKKSRSKQRARASKEEADEDQLEINISSDEKDDASDS